MVAVSAVAQPRVGKVIDFADMKLHLSEGARASIQKDVDALHASPTHLAQRLNVINPCCIEKLLSC